MNLTEKQKNLLKVLVAKVRDEGAGEPILAVGTREGMSFHPMGTGSQFVIDDVWSGDLEALVEHNLLTRRLNSKGTEYLYGIRQMGFDAVDNDFSGDLFDTATTINIGALVSEMTGGNIQAAGSIYDSQIAQVVGDPEALANQLDGLVEDLTKAVQGELQGDQLLDYERLANELKFELLKERPDTSSFSHLLQSLAFFGDIEGTISLISRIWPYLYPFILLITEKLT